MTRRAVHDVAIVGVHNTRQARVLPEEHRLLVETLRALEVVYAPAAGVVGATSHERGQSVPSPSVR